VTQLAQKVHMEKTVPTNVSATMVLSVLLNLENVFVRPGGEDNNAICRVRNHFMAKIAKTNANVKMMQLVIHLTVNIELM